MVPKSARELVVIDGVRTELVRKGSGRPLLYLHAVDGVRPEFPYLSLLAESFEVVAPSHPGFGHSEWPTEFTRIDDLVYFHMTLADHLGLEDAVLVGSSFGGWIAAEMAVCNTTRFASLVLADAYGLKLGGRNERDIADLFTLSQAEIVDLAYHDPAKRQRDYAQMSRDELEAFARSREAFTYFGWKPYLHNPGLKRWLRRIDIPTLILWGENDRVVSPTYGQSYAGLIPNARFELVAACGHYPHIEQPETFARLIKEHVGAVTPARADSVFAE